jgi:hypothetical protein
VRSCSLPLSFFIGGNHHLFHHDYSPVDLTAIEFFKFNRLLGAELNTGGITVAEIAFGRFALCRDEYLSKRTNHRTHSASDASSFVNDQGARFFIPANGGCRAGLSAPSLFALETDRWTIKTLLIESDDPDPCFSGIAFFRMEQRTDHFASPTGNTLLGMNGQDFSLAQTHWHYGAPSIPRRSQFFTFHGVSVNKLGPIGQFS